ncbi:variable large family protein, partial [Borreliella burgdorferi]|uniref:variable large family protein n=1 Tax=Borreliella burgdorferi TaxID=139 RepID=UPI000D3F3C58
DQIAAAIVLRGMAKDGEFALKNDANAEKGLKSTVESAVNKTVADGQKKWKKLLLRLLLLLVVLRI